MTSSSTKETTTLVQNLKAKKLSNFIDGTTSKSLASASTGNKSNTSLMISNSNDNAQNHLPIVFVGNNIDELKLTSERLHDIIDSYNAFRETNEMATSPNTLEEGAIEEEAAAAEELLEEEENHEIIPEVVPPKIPKLKTRFQGSGDASGLDREYKMKQKSLAISLRAFIDCCIQNGMVNRGYLSIIRYCCWF